MKWISTTLIFFNLAALALAQSPFERFYNKPTALDTIYYPFYAGQQLVEVDHIGYWDREIFFLEQTQPRATPHSMYNPPPLGNEYFVRDTTGRVVAAFNNTVNFDSIAAHLRPVGDPKMPTFTHQLRQSINKGVWAYSPQRAGHFGGYYLVSNKRYSDNFSYSSTNTPPNFGLIDTFGRLALPIEYTQIYPVGDAILIQKANKWGALDTKLQPLIPIEYDQINFTQYNKKITFKKDSLWSHYYNIPTKEFKAYPQKGYDNPISETKYLNGGSHIAVSRYGLFGLVDSNYNEILPPQFELFEPQNYQNKYLIKVTKAGKFGYISDKGQTIIPCQYDYINNITTKKPRAVALRDGQYTVFDADGQKVDTTDKQLDWGLQGLGHGICLAYNTARGNTKIYGVWDANNHKMLMPIRFHREPIFPLPNSNFFMMYPQQGDSMAITNFAFNKKSEFKYKEVAYADGYFTAKVGDFYGLIDTNFNQVLPFEYQNLHFCWSIKHTYLFRKNEKWGLISNQNKQILEPIYDNISCTEDGIILAKDNKKGVIGTNLEYKIPCEYDDLRDLGSLKLGVMGEVPYGVWYVKKAGKYGLINHKNQIILPILYDEIISLGYSRCKSGRCAEVRMGKNVYYIDYKK